MVKLSSLFTLLVCMLVSLPVLAQDPIPDVVPVPTVKTTTMDKLLDEAVDKLPPLRKRVMKRILGSPERRAEVIDLCAVKLAENPKLKGYAATFNSEDFDGETEMGVNPDTLKVILDALMKFLPILISLFFKV